MNIYDILGKRRVICDGGMGSLLYDRGLKTGEPSEIMNMRAPEAVYDIHRAYIEAGADIISTNSFGISSLKYKNYDEMLRRAIGIAMEARKGTEALVALDIGPLGRMLRPLGDLDFEDAVGAFKNNMVIGEAMGCDLIIIETMTDLYEAKAALLAAKEATSLPVFVTCAFDKSGKLLTGASPEAMVATLEGMGADAIGLNCSVGPADALDVLKRMLAVASVPVIINPNAGLPEIVGGRAVYDLSPDEFASYMALAARMGASVIGGCCGTTPEYIREMVAKCSEILYTPPTEKDITVISSYTNALVVGERPIIIGERINPTGKPKLKEAITNGDTSYILGEALTQVDEGADALDVNFGLPNIDEPDTLRRGVAAIQSVTDLPLQLDSGNPDALAAAMRVYSGKPFVNSVSGKEDSLARVLPLVKKYGGVVIALLMDDDGIPTDARGRMAIADKIIDRAKAYGISTKDIIFDPLCLTIASGDSNALVTLECVRELTRRGLKSSLGVSNISYGLPERNVINSSFFTLALNAGLQVAIINPHSPEMMNAYYAFMALAGKDVGSRIYCECVRRLGETSRAALREDKTGAVKTLREAVLRGVCQDAERLTRVLLEELRPTEIINEEIIPALDEIGHAFEEKRAFLPALLMSAEAASASFSVIKHSVAVGADNGHAIVLATVRGDIHDIGKNIVRLLFESYGYKVIDLGRDVPTADILEALTRTGAEMLGLSALMTTTVGAMAETIRAVKEELPSVKILVGGAVLTEECAKEIGADYYAPDAMTGVKLAARIVGD